MTNTEITNIITGYKSQYDGKYVTVKSPGV